PCASGLLDRDSLGVQPFDSGAVFGMAVNVVEVFPGGPHRMRPVLCRPAAHHGPIGKNDTLIVGGLSSVGDFLVHVFLRRGRPVTTKTPQGGSPSYMFIIASAGEPVSANTADQVAFALMTS